jgi:hypothetical protein
MAPATFQQQAYAILTAPSIERAIRAASPVTVHKSINYLVGVAKHAEVMPNAQPIPALVIEQLRSMGTATGDNSWHRQAEDLFIYSQILRAFQQMADPVGAATQLRAEFANCMAAKINGNG